MRIPTEDFCNRIHELTQYNGLIENSPVDSLDELLNFIAGLAITGAVPRHKNKAFGQSRFYAFDGKVQHIAAHMRHHHVAKHDIKITIVHDFTKPFRAIGRRGNRQGSCLKRFLQAIAKTQIVFNYKQPR